MMKTEENWKLLARYDQIESLIGKPVSTNPVKWIYGEVEITAIDINSFEWNVMARCEKSYIQFRNLLYEHIKTNYY